MPYHERLLNEATEAGTQRLLTRLPPEQRQALDEKAVHEAIKDAVLYYVEGLDKIARRLDPTGVGRSRA